ncbi:hypothetical protein QJS10_CPA07g01037 [Acorus calamus]|uniref:Uncharacterized protein n=1 Tax=Acorus calamus TaxID=4465 RepID=A0AAV9EFQ4_ACOCL|nr:hypothetical protein QJS10_CPA07g01037 [Acorus calamus]
MSCLTNRIAIVFFRRHRSLLPLRPVIRFSSKDHLVSTEDHEFLSWLQQKAGAEISSALSLGRSIYGRSLFASKFIHAGDCLLKVPYSLHITPQNMIPEVAQLIPDSIGKITQVAMVLLAEKKLGL